MREITEDGRYALSESAIVMSVLETTSALLRGVKGIPRKLFGTRNERLLKVYQRRIGPINDLEAEIRGDYDERFVKRVEQEDIGSLPDEERAQRLAAIRLELSSDLHERTERLAEQAKEHMRPLDDWWASLEKKQQVDEYYRLEYRKRNEKVIEQFDETDFMNEAFAVLREASRRAQDHRHFDCQLIGGRVLFEGSIAEMKTGEGKTIVCHLAAYVSLLCGRSVHVVTVNDYLVKRDAEFAAPIFDLVGMSVGCIQAQLDPGGREGTRRRAYACDITYGTNSEFGFDYLRDNMKTRLEEQVQGTLQFVIVDEVDSILIDEARTPLIISGPARDDVTRYPRANQVAEKLIREQAIWDRKVKSTVTRYDGDARGIPKLEDAMGVLGYKEAKRKAAVSDEGDGGSDAEESPSGEDDEKIATLGPDFLTDDQVEAVQILENDILKIPPAEQYRRFFIVQIERKQVGLTHDGVTIAQDALDLGSLYSGANMEWPHLIENAIRAHKVYIRDKDYVVQEGQIIIVDPFTGRLMHGRQWSDGLHQAVEAKERVSVKEETQTLATITIQNFVKLYQLKAGMTGTALTEATEFGKIYQLEVIEVPTNRPVNRIDHNDKMYRDADEKYAAIVEEIHEVQRRGRPADPFLLADALMALKTVFSKLDRDTGRIDEAIRQFNEAEEGDKKVIGFLLEVYDEAMGDLSHGRPVLVGTTSVENSEKISRLLTKRYGIDHEVLNAKNHSREADIVAKAGYCSVPTKGGDRTPRGNVTIATNMAGRGTDIKLGAGVVHDKCRVPESLPEGTTEGGLYPPGMTKCCIHCDEYDPATNCAHCFKPKLDPRFPELGRRVCPITVPCGLHIIGTERHEARRIDNQLRGRAGRQGDPGSSRFSLSLQDDLLKMFMPDWMLKMMDKLGFTDGTSLEDKRLTKGIERAQRKVEERNFSTRKHLLEWDEPMDYQRKEFYAARQQILEERDLPELIFAAVDSTIQMTVDQYLGGNYPRACIAEWCHTQLDVLIKEDNVATDDLELAQEVIRRRAKDEALDQVRTALGEYIDPEEPPSQWDVGGLLQWANRAFKFSMTQNQLRKMEPGEIEDALSAAAEKLYDEIDLDGIAIYLEPDYAQDSFAEWARTKFNVAFDVQELVDTPQDQVAGLLHDRVRAAYVERERAYPLEWCLQRAFEAEGGNQANSAAMVVEWVNQRYAAGWTLEDVQGKQVDEIKSRLMELSEEYAGGRLDREVQESIADLDRDQAVEWAKERFGYTWSDRRFEQFDGRQAGDTGDFREGIVAQGREMLRWELTRLEQYVLLRLYDQAWKDHLLEMDHLKTAIMQRPLGGDQTHPQSQFAIEGRELFSQMWARITARVTDIIFKIQLASGTEEQTGKTGGPQVSFAHGDATGAGFAGAAVDQSAAMRAQNVEQKVETIRRDKPKVGRNEPCPCGSGKKFKQCHGKK